MVVVVTSGKYGGWGERNVRKPEAAKKKKQLDIKKLKALRKNTRQEQEAHHQ